MTPLNYPDIDFNFGEPLNIVPKPIFPKLQKWQKVVAGIGALLSLTAICFIAYHTKKFFDGKGQGPTNTSPNSNDAKQTTKNTLDKENAAKTSKKLEEKVSSERSPSSETDHPTVVPANEKSLKPKPEAKARTPKS